MRELPYTAVLGGWVYWISQGPRDVKIFFRFNAGPGRRVELTIFTIKVRGLLLKYLFFYYETSQNTTSNIIAYILLSLLLRSHR